VAPSRDYSAVTRTRHVLAAVALALVACDEHVGCTPVLRGEQNELEFSDETLVSGACDRMHSPRALVTGSRFCPHIRCNPDTPGCGEDDERLPEDDVRECYDAAIAGPVTPAGDCLVADAPGELDWTFAPIDCEATDARGYTPQPDRLRLPIVAADEVTGWLEAPGDAFAVRELVDEDGGGFPADAQLGPGREALVLADEEVAFAVVLGHADHVDPVAWNPDAWTLEVTGADVEIGWDEWGVVRVALPADTAIDLAIRRDDLVVPVGRVRAVAPAAVATLDVVVGYARDSEADDGHRAPIGARALARTADGVPVWGVPVAWEVTDGAFPLWRDPSLPWSSDYVALMDREGRACHAPPEQDTTYEGALVARWNGFEVESEMRWDEPEVDESTLEEFAEWFTGERYEEADDCVGPGFPAQGCGCTNAASPPSIVVLGGGLAALVRRRRRRRIDQSAPLS